MAKETIASIKRERDEFYQEFLDLVEEGQIDLNCDRAKGLEDQIRRKINKPSTYEVALDFDQCIYIHVDGYYSDLLEGKDIEVKVFHKNKEIDNLDFNIESVEIYG